MTQFFKQLLRNWQKNLCEYYVLNNNHGSKNSFKKRKKKQIRYKKQEWYLWLFECWIKDDNLTEKQKMDMKEYDIKKTEKCCLECGNEMEYYRKGKLFCNDLCRSRYHNRTKNWTRHYHSKVIGILERNSCILDDLIRQDITSVDLGDLTLWGYNIEYATSVRKLRTHLEYRCFEYRFYRSDNRIYCIEKLGPVTKKR